MLGFIMSLLWIFTLVWLIYSLGAAIKSRSWLVVGGLAVILSFIGFIFWIVSGLKYG